MPATSKNEDIVPESYPYYWPGNSNLSIEQFVAKYKPSMVQDDGTKPWLWVQNSNPNDDHGKREAAVEEATALLNEVTKDVEKIKNDDKIPTRSNKKTGAKSKKELREQVQLEASQKLKDIHTKHGYSAGKWLIFVPPDKVDSVWSRIAVSVAKGPLSETFVDLAKVATTPENESSGQRLICIYMPDVFNQQKVTEVMRILLRNHGVNLSGVKSNLYTAIGLDSKHPSGIQSTIWKNATLLKEGEIKELKDNFFAALKTEQDKSSLDSKQRKLAEKPKPSEDDPFASDDDEEEPEGKPAPQSQNKASKRKKAEAEDGDGDETAAMKVQKKS